MKILANKLTLLLSLGACCVAAATACSSDFDDCSETHSCGDTAAASGTGDSAGKSPVGAGGMAGKAGMGENLGGAIGAGEGGEAAAAGDKGEAGRAETGGCLDENGNPQSGTTEVACGADGSRCVACAPGQACKDGTCDCTADSCPDGCCSSDGKCETQADTHCGEAGSSCDSCGDGLRCDTKTGTCVCDAASCPDGCCSTDGKCLNQTNAHCGVDGAACAACGADQHCDETSGTCACDATTCPDGCCDASGKCVGPSDQSAVSCGAAGAACAACSAGQSCDPSGECACTADSCDGWCHGSSCELFETIASGQPILPRSRGIATSNSDVYWTSSSSTDQYANKWRVQRRVAGGSAETLLSNQAPSLGSLLLGTERLFLLNLDQGAIQSMKADGSSLRTDEAGALTLRFHSGRIYWHDQEPVSNGGKGGAWYDVIIKSQSETDPSDVTQYQGTVGRPDAAGPAEIADLTFAGASVAFGLNRLTYPDEDIDVYQIVIIGDPTFASVFPPSPGRLEQLDCDGNDNYYWRMRASSSGGADLLMQNDGASSATTIATGVDVTDFTLSQSASGKTFVYYAYSDSSKQTNGIRLYDTASGMTYDVVGDDEAGSLVADDTYLYFFEVNGRRLLRTPLPHLVFGLGA